MATELPWVGVVPCAGASRRMGATKALLELEGRTFLERVVGALAAGGCASVLVVIPEGDDALAAAARAAGGEVLLNPDPGEGPITSLRLAIARVSGAAAGLAYLPVDHPIVRPATVARLLEAARESGAPLTVPALGGRRGHPAVFAASLFAELVDPELEGGARTVVHRRLGEARLVEVDDPGVLADVDTPDVYAALVASVDHPERAR
jgi:CTP:molybdopterin cytidylyltransferase MocA